MAPRLESIARYFAFEKVAYCPNLRLEERLASGSDDWIGAKPYQKAKKVESVLV